MNGKSIFKISAALLALASSPNIYAENYWGIGIGSTTWDIKPLFGSYEVEDGTTFDIFMGNRNENFAFEGEMTFSSHDWVGSNGLASHNAMNLIVAAVGYLPVSDNFEIYGKMGADFWSTTVDFVGTNYDGDDGVSLALGVGANINASETFSLRAEYKAMSGLGDGLDEGDIGQFTVSAVFKY